jgi:hypothetical protein
MFNSSSLYLLLGALALFSIVVIAICARLMNRERESSFSSEFFGPNYQRDLLRYSDLSEMENMQNEYQSRFTPFRFRDPNTSKPSTNDDDTDCNSL